jgi:hypothetical protein
MKDLLVVGWNGRLSVLDPYAVVTFAVAVCVVTGPGTA